VDYSVNAVLCPTFAEIYHWTKLKAAQSQIGKALNLKDCVVLRRGLVFHDNKIINY